MLRITASDNVDRDTVKCSLSAILGFRVRRSDIPQGGYLWYQRDHRSESRLPFYHGLPSYTQLKVRHPLCTASRW